jgi:hypothetical protein
MGIFGVSMSSWYLAQGRMQAAMIAAQTVASFEGGGYTGDGPRSGCIDGKGGFMAIMHPRETVTDETRPGSRGEGDITVSNTYNIQSGVTRSELQPLLEQTRRATIAEIADLRRRGRN